MADRSVHPSTPTEPPHHCAPLSSPSPGGTLGHSTPIAHAGVINLHPPIAQKCTPSANSVFLGPT